VNSGDSVYNSPACLYTGAIHRLAPSITNYGVCRHRASGTPAHALHWLAIHKAKKTTILRCTTSDLFLTMNDMVGGQFYKKNSLRVSFSVRVRFSDSITASVSFVVNVMFEIAVRGVPLALYLHTP